MGWRELERMKTVFIEHLRTSLSPLAFRVHDDKDSKFLAVVGFFMRLCSKFILVNNVDFY